MPVQKLDPPVGVDVAAVEPPTDETAAHHRRKAPHEHLCTCGRLREDCVRDTVRAVWSM